jgi:CubicO group peptidase (beta-lactamase class C family)
MLKQRIHDLIQSAAEKERFSGVVAIGKDDEPFFSGAYGYASRSWKIINDREMKFAVASATKMFTAVAVLQLIEKGRLSLESKVQNILKLDRSLIPPEVTVRHLLMHTSGLPDYYEAADAGAEEMESLWAYRPNYSVKTLADFLPLIPNKFPAFEPGSDFSYCNAGYILLGLMIEKVTDLSYFEVVQRSVFTRSGMKNSGFLPLDHTMENVAEGHIPVRDEEGRVIGWRKNIFAVPLLGASDGGAYSTARDLITFLRALREGILLGEATTKEMLQSRGKVHQDENGRWTYGFGLAFLLDGDEVVRYGHAGDDPGVSVKIFHYPRQNADLVILGNQSGCAEEIGAALHEIIANW